MKPGDIHVTRTQTGYKQYSYTFRLEGDQFHISRESFIRAGVRPPSIGQRFSFGDASLVAIEYDWEYAAIMAVRDTQWFWIAYHLIASPVARWCRFIFNRIILTLAIWNLAEWEDGAVPSLDNIWRKWRKK